MTTVAKSTPIGSVGLSQGKHLVRVHVGEETVSFEVESSAASDGARPAPRQPTGFVEKWSGTARKVVDPADAWLTHLNEKHLR